MNRLPVRLAFLLLCVLAISVFAQEQPTLTLDNMNDPAFARSFQMPRTFWLSDNTALIYDPRIPDSIRTLERLDPKSGKRTPYLNRTKAAASFTALFPEGKAPRFNPMPASITTDGRHGLYLIGGDIFVLDIPKATAHRITETAEEEKNVQFSPDGLKLAFNRGTNLFAYDILQKKEHQLTSDGTKTLLNGTLSWVYWEEIFGRRDIGYWWSHDSKAIAYLQTDESEVSLQSIVDISPWTPTVSTQRYPKIGEKNPVVRVGITEVGSGSTVWAALDPNSFEYVIRVDWIPDNKRICVRTMNRLQTELDFHFVDRKSGAATFTTKDTDPGWLNMSDDLYFLKDGKHFLCSSERDGYAHLYRFTIDGMLVNQVTKGDWALTTSGGLPFWVQKAVVGIDEDAEWIYFTSLEKSSVEKHLYRIRLDGKKMERLSGGDGTHGINMSPDAKYYFDQFSNISTPPSLTLRDTRGKVAHVLATSDDSAFKKYGVQFAELLKVPARDGFLLPATITKPRDYDPNKKYPVVVKVYGGPSAPTVANAFDYGAVLDNVLGNNGYIVVKIDNRSSTAISKKLENLILNRVMGEIELNDLVDAVQWFKKLPYIDPNRFGITGWSGGGSYTILALSRSKEFKAGIAGAGVTDFRFYDTKWGEAAMKTEKENLKGMEENSLLKYAKDLTGRLMLVHGTHDDNVHIQNTWRYVNELIKAGKIFDLMVYPLRGHGVGDPAGRRHLNATMLDFWKRNL